MERFLRYAGSGAESLHTATAVRGTVSCYQECTNYRSWLCLAAVSTSKNVTFNQCSIDIIMLLYHTAFCACEVLLISRIAELDPRKHLYCASLVWNLPILFA